jgi:hypothetical protein
MNVKPENIFLVLSVLKSSNFYRMSISFQHVVDHSLDITSGIFGNLRTSDVGRMFCVSKVVRNVMEVAHVWKKHVLHTTCGNDPLFSVNGYNRCSVTRILDAPGHFMHKVRLLICPWLGNLTVHKFKVSSVDEVLSSRLDLVYRSGGPLLTFSRLDMCMEICIPCRPSSAFKIVFGETLEDTSDDDESSEEESEECKSVVLDHRMSVSTMPLKSQRFHAPKGPLVVTEGDTFFPPPLMAYEEATPTRGLTGINLTGVSGPFDLFHVHYSAASVIVENNESGVYFFPFKYNVDFEADVLGGVCLPAMENIEGCDLCFRPMEMWVLTETRVFYTGP